MKKSALLLVLCFALLAGCKKDQNQNSEPTKAKRVVIAYMFGDVNLWSFILQSVEQMERDAPDKEDGTLLVYLDYSPSATQFRAPVLLEISKNDSKGIQSRVVKTYPVNQDAGDPAVFGSVLKDAKDLYTADSYGLIMAGHGNGWTVTPPLPHGKSIGNSGRIDGKFLDIDEMAAAIPSDLHFDFIAFHACNMAEAAALYQLKDKCNYVVASIEALPGPAFPYHLVTKHLFAQPNADLTSFIGTTAQYYRTEADPTTFDYFTLGLYQMDKMNELAAVTKKCMDTRQDSYDAIRSALWADAELNFDSLMCYPWPKMIPLEQNTQPFYDFALFRNSMYTYDSNLPRELRKALTDVVKIVEVVGSNNRPMPQIERYAYNTAGISLYFPNKQVSAESDNAYYDRFAWAKAAGFTREKDRD